MRALILVFFSVLVVGLAGGSFWLMTSSHATPVERSFTAKGPDVDNWDILFPDEAYSFVPEEISDDLWDDPDFQANMEKADTKTVGMISNSPTDLPGYMVPLVYEGEMVHEFLLVPMAGQCVHVPPPPINQTVFVKMKSPIKMRTLYEPIVVKGSMSAKTADHDLAVSGYELKGTQVANFDNSGQTWAAPEADGDLYWNQ